MVVLVHVHTHCEQGGGHFCADVARLIDWVYGEVAALDARTVAHVAAFHLVAGCIRTFFGVEFEERAVHLNGEAHVVKHEEFCFWTKENVGAQAGIFNQLLSLLCGTAWVTLVKLTGDRILYVTEDNQLGLGGERIHHSGFHVWNQQHVGLVNSLPASDGRTIEHNAFVESIFIHGVRAHRQMLKLAARIGEANVNIFYVVFFDHLFDVSISCHAKSFRNLRSILKCSGIKRVGPERPLVTQRGLDC